MGHSTGRANTSSTGWSTRGRACCNSLIRASGCPACSPPRPSNGRPSTVTRTSRSTRRCTSPVSCGTPTTKRRDASATNQAPKTAGYLLRVHVADTDEQAQENAREFMWMQGQFTGVGHPYWVNPSGYSSASKRLEYAKFANAGVFKSRAAPYEDQLRTHEIVAGSPETVIRELRVVLETCRPSILMLWGNDGNISHEASLRCIELTGKEVIPALREMGDELGLHDPFELDTPVSLKYTPPGAAPLHISSGAMDTAPLPRQDPTDTRRRDAQRLFSDSHSFFRSPGGDTAYVDPLVGFQVEAGPQWSEDEANAVLRRMLDLLAEGRASIDAPDMLVYAEANNLLLLIGPRRKQSCTASTRGCLPRWSSGGAPRWAVIVTRWVSVDASTKNHRRSTRHYGRRFAAPHCSSWGSSPSSRRFRATIIFRPDDDPLPVGRISFGDTTATGESPDRFLGEAPIVNTICWRASSPSGRTQRHGQHDRSHRAERQPRPLAVSPGGALRDAVSLRRTGAGRDHRPGRFSAQLACRCRP